MKQAQAFQPSTSDLMSELPPIENNYPTKGTKNKDGEPMVEEQTPAREVASTSSPTTSSQPHTANTRTCPLHSRYPHLPSVVTWHLFLQPRVSPPTPTPILQICASDCPVAEWVDGYGWVTGDELEQLKQCLALSQPSPSLPPLIGPKGARKAACPKTGVVTFTFIAN